MTSESQTIANELTSLRKFNKDADRLVAELSPAWPHTIGPEELQFLEVPFLKPTSKNPRIRKA